MRFIIGEKYLTEALIGLIGTARPYLNIVGNDSGITRILPKAHPQWPWLVCDTMENIAGQQYVDSVDWEFEHLGPDGKMLAEPLPTYARYREYELQASFSPKQYSISTDQFMINNKINVSYVNPKGQWTVLPIMPEWKRYVTVYKTPRVEMMMATQGGHTFMGKIGFFPNGDTAGAGQLKAMVPCADVTLKWHSVPYSFILGKGYANPPFAPDAPNDGMSVFDFAGGTINQNAFLGFPAGTLLFMGAEPTNIRAVPFPVAAAAKNLPNRYLWLNDRICDIEMKFQYRNPPTDVEYPKPKEEGNRVYAGHNLMLNAQDGKYYVVFWAKCWDTKPPADPNTPTRNQKPFPFNVAGVGLVYNSFAHELLFTNPDFTVPFLI